VYASWNARAVGLAASAAESIEIAAECGFEGVDLLVRDIVEADADIRALRRRMDDLGLRGGGWTLPMNWKNDREAFERDLAKLPRHAEVAAELGLFQTGTWVRYETDPVADGILASPRARTKAFDDATAWQIERLGRIADVLAEHQSRLGLEIIGSRSERTGRGAPLIATYRELLERFKPLRDAHSNVGVLADAYHLDASGEDVDEALAWGGGAVAWVHLADPANPDRSTLRDTERALPGESDAGLCRRLLAALDHLGCDAPVTVEPLGACRSFPSEDMRERARMARESLNRVWPERPSA